MSDYDDIAIEQMQEERDALRANVETLTRERDWLRRDLCEIADGRGVGVPDQSEAKKRIIAIRTERDALQARFAAMEMELPALRSNVRRLGWEKDELKARLAAMTALLSSANDMMIRWGNLKTGEWCDWREKYESALKAATEL